MKRDIDRLSHETFDVTIVGGGIYGAMAAWDASSRGLKVALIEKGDFGNATSANTQKIIHGGLRYLQHFDFKRMRESIRERRNWLRIAPHLVRPMPVMMPTHGAGMKSKFAMSCAMFLNDLISLDRNRGIKSKKRHISRCRVISKKECLSRAKGLDSNRVTGAAIWNDAQVLHSERLTLSVVREASEHGAALFNYVECTGFDVSENRIQGVLCRDVSI